MATPNLYVLVVDKAWAKLYRTGTAPEPLKLVYHHALFGAPSGADDELARSLCRLLRADRQTGKYERLAMLASSDMLDALRRQYDGEWRDVIVGRIEDLPVGYGDADVGAAVRHLLSRRPVSGGALASEPGHAAVAAN